MKSLSNMENWQKASVIVSVVLSLALLVNTSLMAYINYQDNFQASITGQSRLESLDIDMKADIGRPSPLMHYLRRARSWISAYYVGGTERTNAETGLIVSITGSNIGSTVSVDYYVEAVPQSGGSAYRFLEGNSTSVTVGGADLDLSNQTSIENHLQAMGLSTTASHTIDYYVYVKAEATGAISGDTLTSEITYQKFDTVEYQYGSEVSVSATGQNYHDDGYVRIPQDYATDTGQYFSVGDSTSVDYDYWGWVRCVDLDVPQGASITSAEFSMQPYYARNPPNYPELIIKAETSATPARISSCTDYTGRDKTSANTTEQITSFDTSSGDYMFFDVTDVVQEVVDLGAWVAESDIMIFIMDPEGHDGQDFVRFSSAYIGEYPTLDVDYITYSASWYPIGPVSVLSMPLGQALGAITVILVSLYALYYTLRRKEKKK